MLPVIHVVMMMTPMKMTLMSDDVATVTWIMILLVKDDIMPVTCADEFALCVSSRDLKQGVGCITWLLQRT